LPTAAFPALTGDITTTAGSLATSLTTNSATTGNRIVTALGQANTGTIPVARLGTSSGSATTFLNGTGAFSSPTAAPSFSVGATVTTNTTISGSSVVYPVNDGVTVTLPLASTAGQVIILIDVTAQSTGITIQRQGSNTITDGQSGGVNVTSVAGYAIFRLVSDGAGHWYGF
jgi:hypothetical protein